MATIYCHIATLPHKTSNYFYHVELALPHTLVLNVETISHQGAGSEAKHEKGGAGLLLHPGQGLRDSQGWLDDATHYLMALRNHLNRGQGHYCLCLIKRPITAEPLSTQLFVCPLRITWRIFSRTSGRTRKPLAGGGRMKMRRRTSMTSLRSDLNQDLINCPEIQGIWLYVSYFCI